MLIEIKQHIDASLDEIVEVYGYKPSNVITLGSDVSKGKHPILYAVYIPDMPNIPKSMFTGKTWFSITPALFKKRLPHFAFVDKISLPIYDNRDSMLGIIAESLGIKNVGVMDRANTKLTVKEL